MTLLDRRDDGTKTAERKFAEMQTYFSTRWKNLSEIKTEKDLRTIMAEAYELESISIIGRQAQFEFDEAIGAVTVTNSGLRLERVISLFVNGVLATFKIDLDGKAYCI